MRKKYRYLTAAGMIAALYTTLTLVSAAFGLSSGVIQIRLSEALCVLPIYTGAAVPGVTLGCFISNLLTGGTAYDLIFGTLATFIGAYAAGYMKKLKYAAFIPTVISNSAIIPAVLIFSGVGGWDIFPYLSLTVGVGELISCGILGGILIRSIDKHRSVGKLLT